MSIIQKVIENKQLLETLQNTARQYARQTTASQKCDVDFDNIIDDIKKENAAVLYEALDPLADDTLALICAIISFAESCYDDYVESEKGLLFTEQKLTATEVLQINEQHFKTQPKENNIGYIVNHKLKLSADISRLFYILGIAKK